MPRVASISGVQSTTSQSVPEMRESSTISKICKMFSCLFPCCCSEQSTMRSTIYTPIEDSSSRGVLGTLPPATRSPSTSEAAAGVCQLLVSVGMLIALLIFVL